jgi:hypothetical protein
MEMTGEIKPIQGNPLGMRLAQALRAMRGALDARPPGWVGKGGDVLPPGTLPDDERLKLGTALMGQSPEEAERIAQGDYPMRMPEMSNIPQFKTGRKQSTADLLFTGMDLAPLANVAHKGAGRIVQALRKAPNAPAGYNKAPPTLEPSMSEQFDPSRRDAMKKIAGGTTAAAGVVATAPDALRSMITKAVENKAMNVAPAVNRFAPVAKAFHFQGFKPWSGAWAKLTPRMQNFMRHSGFELAEDVVANPLKRAEFDAIVNRFPEGSDEVTDALMERGFMRYEPRAIAGENGEDFLDDLPDHLRRLYENDPDFSRENLRKLAEDSEWGDY